MGLGKDKENQVVGNNILKKGGKLMIRGLYSAASGLLAAQDRQDIIAGNLANVETTGFKKQRVLTESFADMFMTRLDQDSRRAIGGLNPGVAARYSYTDFQEGPAQYTENPYDFAIAGPGFFVLETPEGPRYSRDGAFTRNEDGFLVNQSGYQVLDREGEPIFADEFFYAGELAVVEFASPQELTREGDNLYAAPEEAGEPELIEREVMAGYLEGSNVNPVLEMTRMISAVRLFEAGQSAIRAQDETLEKAVNQVGNTR